MIDQLTIADIRHYLHDIQALSNTARTALTRLSEKQEAVDSQDLKLIAAAAELSADKADYALSLLQEWRDAV